MSDEGLTAFIVSYIKSREQPKLEAFDKEAEKRLAGLTQAEDIALAQQEIAQQRQELIARYEVRNWLTDAANRAGQISLVTHALKFTHSDAKGSSVFNLPAAENDAIYLSSATLGQPAVDAVGNAAALDVAKLLQTEHNGDSLLACLNRADNSPLAALAENPQQLALWVEGFKQALVDKQLTSHKLAKQFYFPVGLDQYHLLSPLFSSSLAQAMHQRIAEARFSDQSKEAKVAHKAGKWHSEARVIYLKTAVQNIGGTKPQNISYLNSVRGGKVWLLPCGAPPWKNIQKPPIKYRSIFHDRSEFTVLARNNLWQMQQYLLGVKPLSNTMDIRAVRLACSDEIIDILFNYVAEIQNLDGTNGWSDAEDCKLKRSEQLWLDPNRAMDDPVFKLEREKGDWKQEVSQDFGYWLNRWLQHDELVFGYVEQREWSSLFKQRLREFEQGSLETWS
ncbi:type I-F CRISPR-associated protein Csy1 [Yersinia pseudotuberculosis]|uniref:type I-F CRISPR-associated protein Csy1 n=1 Tax=Yersinia pseudotuberculosis TaxID=633 RepID=UPI00034B8AA7|nr:type I-F CRISPR-associated protein Csy1 [Yersinia pseudotuberculosis]QES98747.1 type I-F CRISPR-associated protein Csy1 [Yersinia pseudotuberculosis]CFU96073.1 CRISPR-associated protein%2C Csy1 family [Yersinia pseudotuberculosis]CNB39629.1 CRISPR-associated protein%2C Csy1 family [Yersinia pseudotuberculosis]CNB49425.1 CRISPR-associated protein%2C Csy1 family [Yersinia pseudotuberculosis]CRY59262.1 CRISPR-associated protein%2C Csy1 family [Yersinia pseudotuberculosis]